MAAQEPKFLRVFLKRDLNLIQTNIEKNDLVRNLNKFADEGLGMELRKVSFNV